MQSGVKLKPYVLNIYTGKSCYVSHFEFCKWLSWNWSNELVERHYTNIGLSFKFNGLVGLLVKRSYKTLVLKRKK